MKKQTITVRNPFSGGSILHRLREDQEEDYYEVEAYCVGGEEGVFAIYESSKCPGCFEYAQGDDGFWWFAGVMSKSWYPEVVEAMNSILNEEQHNGDTK